MRTDPVTFLCIEDDDIDFWAIERVMQKLKISNPIVRATDGLEALNYLNAETTTENLLDSLVIILDLNLPGENGFDILNKIKNSPRFRHIPIIITTTSDANRDLQQAGQYGVVDYVLKSDLIDGLREALDELNPYTQISLRSHRRARTSLQDDRHVKQAQFA